MLKIRAANRHVNFELTSKT